MEIGTYLDKFLNFTITHNHIHGLIVNKLIVFDRSFYANVYIVNERKKYKTNNGFRNETIYLFKIIVSNILKKYININTYI